jgi:hypothetical protein
MARKKFDRKFVLAAVLVGVAYTVIVVSVEKIVGKEAAGVAGVMLTAIAVGTLQKFETLRFRRISADESTWIDIPPVSVSRVIVLIFAFFWRTVRFWLCKRTPTGKMARPRRNDVNAYGSQHLRLLLRVLSDGKSFYSVEIQHGRGRSFINLNNIYLDVCRSVSA